MTDLPLVFLGGLLGSGHCVGMCGPLAITLGAVSPRPKSNFTRQIAFSCGRIFTYAFCGAAAGFSGTWLAVHSGTLVLSQAVLAIVAGVALTIVGLTSTGILPRVRLPALTAVPCSAATGIKTMLQFPGLRGAALAGVFTGFIPCGLVYAFLIKAVSSGGPLEGAATMAAFGAGTAPLMTLTGVGASALRKVTRARLVRFAAWCVVVTGVATVARGAWQFGGTGDSDTPACPFCARVETTSEQ